MSLCWLSQQFTSVLQILATWIIASSAFLLPLIFKRERARSRVSSLTIVIAKPNESKVEKALEWPPGSQCLTPGVGMRNVDFSAPWEASNTSLHQKQGCRTDWTLRSSQKTNSYFPATTSFLLELETEPKIPKQRVWPLLSAARALGAPTALLLGPPCAPYLAAPHSMARCPHLVTDARYGATSPLTKLLPGMALSPCQWPSGAGHSPRMVVHRKKLSRAVSKKEKLLHFIA